jgi:hypothetical protein
MSQGRVFIGRGTGAVKDEDGLENVVKGGWGAYRTRDVRRV